MNFDYDVTIIGAGPIGSSLAYELAKENIRVCLIDKKKIIGLPLQCAGIINKKVLDFNQIPKEFILNNVRGANLHSKNYSLTVSKEEYQALIIDRVALDQYLYNRAIENGVHSYLSSKAMFINDMTGEVEFQNDSKKRSICSKIIVGADGPLSMVASSIGNEFNYYCASQYLIKVDEIKEMDFVDLYVYEHLLPGFIWVIPVYENIYRIGLFSNHDYEKQTEILDDFMNNDFKYDDYEVIEKHKGKIPIFNKNNKLYENRVLIIGDAAAQIKPSTGGGLLIGFETIPIVKKSIINALNYEVFNSNKINLNLEKNVKNEKKILHNVFENYQKDFEKKFLREITIQLKVQETLCILADDDLDYFFKKLKEKKVDELISQYGDMVNQSILVKELLKRGLLLSLLPSNHKKKLMKIWFTFNYLN